MPLDPNRGSSFAGQVIRLGRRQSAVPSCRDEVIAALAALSVRGGKQAFTVCEVYAEMLARGTAYAEATVFKTMQRMKEPPIRPPLATLGTCREGGLPARSSVDLMPLLSCP